MGRFYGEYHLRVTTVTPPLQMETEDNGSLCRREAGDIDTAGNSSSASIAATSAISAILIIFNLGTVSNGYLSS